MKNTVINFLEQVKQSRIRRRKAAAILVCLSLIVAGGTTWALHINGESQTGETYCGYDEEHQHSEACVEKALICGYDTEGTTAAETEAPVHTHDESCYEEQTVLTCELEESAGHTHSEECYDADGTLICGMEESEGHTHSEENGCYTTEQVLVCGLEEGAPETTEATTETTLENPTHVHTDECYEITYICNYDYEHVHTLSCYSNPEADLETAEDWEQTVANVELTGDFATDLVAIARIQLGYAESTDNYQVVLDDEGNETTETKGYTRYGAWYGDAYGDWCAMFVSFCLNYADITSEMVPYAASCPEWVESLSELGFYEPVYVEELDEDGNTISVRNDYTPETGDLIFFDWDGNGSANHVGIVEELETKETANEDGTVSYEYTVHTIEGNSSGKVTQREYDLYDEEILGYGSIYSVYLSAVDNGLIDGIRHLTAETEDGVTFSAIGEIPENAVLEVSPLTGEQIAYIGENFDSVALGESGNYAYDIKILLDGEEYTPESPIHISVSGLGIDYHYSVTGYHLADVDADTLTDVDAAEVNVEQTDVNSTGNRISYDADGFSISVFTVGAAATFSDVNAVDSLTIKLKTMTYNKQIKYYDQEDANGAKGEALPSDGNYTCYEYTENGSHYYLIPVEYLSEKYENSGFEFSETQACPFVYLTDATTLDWTKAPAGSYAEINETYYLQVECASGKTPVICYTVLNVATDTVTPSNTVINMFDYWTTTERSDSDNHASTINNSADLNRGINYGHALKFGKNMGGSPGKLNYSYGGTETPSKVTAGIVEKTLSDGYPILTSNSTLGTNGESLSYLFDPNEEADGKASFTRVTGLLSVDSQGYFYYNSAERYAQLNEETKAFTVYEEPAGHNTSLGVLGLGNDTYGQFYPYNDGHQVALLDNAQDPINHYFGMTLTTKFIQRNSGYTSIAKSTPITFEFSGDNDVWIFIDDVLVADLGGLSSARSVKIDFSTGQVTINDGTSDNPSTTLKAAFTAAGKDDTVEWLEGTNTFADNTTHTLKFYYLERGNYDSNLMLKYNLIDIPATSIFKVDQYGDDVGGATFAVYQYDSTADKGTADTDEYGYITTGGATVSLKYLTQVDSEGGVTTNSYYVDPVSGVITVNKENTSYTIKPVYVGQTDSEGEMIFMDEEGITYSQSELRDAFGEYFVLREIKVPDGYRTVSDDVILYFKDKLLQCYDPYSTGVWANPNALVTATDKLYIADDYDNNLPRLTDIPENLINDDGSINYYDPSDGSTNGTMFAVVLKRASSETINNVTADTIKSWEPVYGNDVKGYTTVSFGTGCDYQSQLEAILAAAKESADYGYDITFTYGANGMQLLFENLPGDASSYYTYLLNNGGDTSDAKYVIAYFYTTADSVAEATTGNTVRIRSHGQTAAEGTTGYNAFTIQWGATIEVPNIINALYFQKADSDGDLLDDAVFALYDAAADSNNKGYYVGKDSNSSTVYIRLDEADGTAKDGAATVYTALGAESGTAGTYTINTTDLSVPADGEGTGYITAEGIGTITVQVGDQTYTITPATNAGSQSLVGYTHNSCSYVTNENGTGHFHLLKKGTYYLKEIAPPDGYSLNYVNVPVEVTEEGVYANAGTADNDVRVGNGAGYLVKTMDVFASLGEIDETLSWIYTHLKVASSSNGDFLNDLDETFYVHSGYTNDYGFNGYGKSNGKSTSYIPEGALTSGTGSDLIKVNDATSFPIEEAMTQYLRYEGDLTETVDTKSVFDYALYKDADGSIRGVQSYRLWTESGWSDLAIYQDTTYGESQSADTTNYKDLTNYGEISYLFSSSTFVQVTDAVDVDLTVTKVTTDFETNSGNAATTYLDGAEFTLTNSHGKYYKYTPATETTEEKTDWVDDEKDATRLTTKTLFTCGEGENQQTVEVTAKVSVTNGVVTKTYTINGMDYNLTNYETNGAATFTKVGGTDTLFGTLQRSFFKIYNLTEDTYTLKEVAQPTYSLTLGGITEDKSFKAVDAMTITLTSGEYWYYETTGTENTIIVPQADLGKEYYTVTEADGSILSIPKTFKYRTEDGTVVDAAVISGTKNEQGGYTFTFTYKDTETTNTLYLEETSGFTLEVSGAAATRVAKVDSTGTTAAYYDSTTTAYQGGFRVINSSETSDESLTLVKVDATPDTSKTKTSNGYTSPNDGTFTVSATTGTGDDATTTYTAYNYLTGAKFYLYYKTEDENEGEETKYYYGTTTVGGNKTVVQWSEDLENADKFEVGADGSLTFNSLNENNTYYLVECQAPDGYSLLNEELEIKWVDSDNDGTKELTVTGVTSDDTYHLETVSTTTGEGDGAVTTSTTYLVIYNSSGYSLPETGGAGTHMFTLGGIAILAVITLVYGCGLRRKRERRAK